MSQAKKSKIVLITGGGRGLGRNMALAVAKAGHDVVITYRKQADAASLAREVEGLGRKAGAVELDVKETKKFDTFVEELKKELGPLGAERIDAVVQNAGVGDYKPYGEYTEEALDELYRVQLKAPFLLTQKLLPLIADGGRIINVSSGLARFSTPGYSAYAAMKGAIEVLTRYQAKELAGRGITANCIAPGAIETDFTKRALSHDESRAHIESAIAMGRVGQPDDIGPMVALLVDDGTHWMTGQRLEVSGGMNL